MPIVNQTSRHAVSILIVQALAFIAGILIVRTMEKQDYAGYAICVSLLSAVAMVAEGGLNSTLMSIGGKNRHNRQAFAELFASVMRFRLVLAGPLILVGGIAATLMLVGNGFETPQIVVSVLITTVSMWVALTAGSLLTVLQLEYEFAWIRAVNIVAALVRVCIIALIFWGNLGNLEMLLAVSLLVSLATNVMLKRRVSAILPTRRPNMKLYKDRFTLAARQVMPMNFAMVLAEQSIFIVLTVYGSTSSIAEVQALARFGVVFLVLNRLISDLGAPYMARMVESSHLLTRGFFPVLMLYGLVSVPIIALGTYYGETLLGVLGSQYAGLEESLMVILIGVALNQFAQAFGVLNQARGWLKYSWIYIALTPGWVVAGITLLDLSSTMGAALFMGTQPIALLVTQMVRMITGYNREMKRSRRLAQPAG